MHTTSPFPFDDHTWIIADTHFFHTRIGLYCDRPDDWQARILAQWQSLVGPEEVVFHLGDLALGGKDAMAQLMTELPGQLYLLRGNHDRHSKAFYESLGIQMVPDPLEIRANSGQRLIFSHRPILPLAPNVLNLHGHVHNNPTPGLSAQHLDLCVDVRQYRPWQSKDVLASYQGE